MSGALTEYLWIAVVGTITGFVYAFGIGANDVANAFASSVSSKSLTLKQAVCVAGVFEFLGAYFLGASVTSTIRSKVVDIDLYESEPEILMLGMFTSLLTAAGMLLTATYFGLPVSTTHTVVGCIIGFSIAAKGFDSVDWDTTTKIFISWLASPLLSGAIGFLLFGLLRYFVLNSEHAFERGYYSFPIVLFVGIFINVFYVLYKAGANFGTDELPFSITIPTACGFGVAAGLIWIWPMGPFARKRIEGGNVHIRDGASKKVVSTTEGAAEANEKDEEGGYVESEPGYSESEGDEVNVDDYNDKLTMPEPKPKKEKSAVSSSSKKVSIKPPAENDKTIEEESEEDKKEEDDQPKGMLRKMSQSFANNTYDQDLHGQSMYENSKAAEIWDNAELYDENVEQMFTYVQVFTACLNAFAHGANDVANAIAPISAIITIYQTGEVSSKTGVQKWLLAYGGAAIVVGLLLYGYKVMKSIGYKLTMMSPSRGASAELAASLTVVTASFLGIPVSSTQCIVGAVSGVGLTQGWRNVQWLFLGRVCIGWVAIFFVSAVLSAGIFAFLAFSPSI